VDVRRLVTEATAMLAAAGVQSARVDAELLAAHVLGLSRGALLTAPELDAAQEGAYRQLVARRASRVPLQHLTGTAPFRHVELAVGPGVFIPRPETELLVEWGLRWLRAQHVDKPKIVDLCAGSGAIALAVATEALDPSVWAVELSPDALPWLRRNVSSAGVHVIPGDVTDPFLLTEVDGTVDLVLSNPPYVPLRAVALPQEVLDYDPPMAVFGGVGGLDIIVPLINRAATLLRPGGGFGVEHDETHVDVVTGLLRATELFTDVTMHRDLAGRPRFTTAVRGDGPARVAD
jgi:release factor glutamine methyltransferase